MFLAAAASNQSLQLINCDTSVDGLADMALESTTLPTASSSSSVSWSWLSHQHRQQQQQQRQEKQKQPQQQQQQQQDCKSEVIIAADCRPSAVIYGQQADHHSMELAGVKEACDGGANDQQQQQRQQQLIDLHGSGGGNNDAKLNESKTHRCRHQRSSSSMSLSGIITDGASSKTAREQISAINNATNCDRWQQISCSRARHHHNRRSLATTSTSASAARQQQQSLPERVAPVVIANQKGGPKDDVVNEDDDDDDDDDDEPPQRSTTKPSNPLNKTEEQLKTETAPPPEEAGRGNIESNNNSCSTNEAMEILRKHHQQHQQRHQIPNNHYYQEQTPVNYPNNTLIVDLIKCHRNIATVWPHASRIESSLGQLKSAACCWPNHQQEQQPQSHQHGGFRKFKGCKQFNFQMPEPLARTNIRLKSDVYDKALSVLTSDIRYQLHLLLYRRIQTIWLLLSTIFCIVMPVVVVANLELLIVLGALCVWLSLQLLGIVLTKQFRAKLDEMLERSVAQVNSFFMEHNLMLGVINVGSLTRKAKLNIPMVYFDTSQCREQIESIISIATDGGAKVGGQTDNDDCSSSSGSRSGSSNSDIINNNNNVHGEKCFLDYSKLGELMPTNHLNQYQQSTLITTTTRPTNVAIALAQSQMAKKILLRYSQRWISQYDKRKLMFADDNLEPRHLSTGKCLCQFIEEQLNSNNNKTENVKTSSSSSQRHLAKYERCNTDGKPTATSTGGDFQVVIDISAEPEVKARKLTEQQLPNRSIVPSLSRLVSLRDNSQGIYVPNGFVGLSGGDNSPAPSSVGSNVDDELSREPSEVDLQSTTRDVSLELGCDSIGRSDDLVKRLRLLLELRKNDLHGIEGSLFSDIHSKQPHFLSTFNQEPAIDSHTHSTGYTTADSLTIDSSHDHQSVRTPPPPPPVEGKKSALAKGKKIFRQRDGLFLLGMIGAKKSQQQQQHNHHQHQQPRDRILEIR